MRRKTKYSAAIVLFLFLFLCGNARIIEEKDQFAWNKQSCITVEQKENSQEYIPNGLKTRRKEKLTLSKHNLRATGAVLYDAKEGRVLFGKNENKQLAMASTTKIMTLILALELGNLNDVVTASAKASVQPKVHLGLKKGEQYRLKDLLYAMMLESYNDCAVAIAEHISGSVKEFCQEMTIKARNLGCIHTSFETPNGLDSDNHFSTPKEMAIIASYALKNKEFCKIIGTKQYSFACLNNQKQNTVSNKDRFLDQYPGAIGVKTGYTSGAGYCFVGAVNKKDKTLVSVVLGCGWPPNKSLKWKDTKILMDYGFSKFKQTTIVKPSIKIPYVPVRNGVQKQVAVAIKEEKKMYLGKQEQLDYELALADCIDAPCKKGEIAGWLHIYVNQKNVAKIPVLCEESIKEKKLSYFYKKILQLFF